MNNREVVRVINDKTRILLNGGCVICNERIIKSDELDSNWLFYNIDGLRIHKKEKRVTGRCRRCKNFLELIIRS